MTNQVDTSEETINAEFDAAEKEIGTDQPEGNTNQPDQANQPNPMEEAQKQAEIQMAAGMIATSLRFAVGAFAGVTVQESHYQQAAESYAVLIIKYYPGGLFALLDRYKEELGAATATFVLIGAVSKAKAEKREEEEAKAKQEAIEKAQGKTPQPAQQSRQRPASPTNSETESALVYAQTGFGGEFANGNA